MLLRTKSQDITVPRAVVAEFCLQIRLMYIRREIQPCEQPRGARFYGPCLLQIFVYRGKGKEFTEQLTQISLILYITQIRNNVPVFEKFEFGLLRFKQQAFW